MKSTISDVAVMMTRLAPRHLANSSIYSRYINSYISFLIESVSIYFNVYNIGKYTVSIDFQSGFCMYEYKKRCIIHLSK
jgi:hypothetical protein